MDKLGTWLAIAAVGIGFIILVWLLFASNRRKRRRIKRSEAPRYSRVA